jgi:hypothetical protein
LEGKNVERAILEDLYLWNTVLDCKNKFKKTGDQASGQQKIGKMQKKLLKMKEKLFFLISK